MLNDPSVRVHGGDLALLRPRLRIYLLVCTIFV